MISSLCLGLCAVAAAMPSPGLPGPADSLLALALDTLDLVPAQMDFDRHWATGVHLADDTVLLALEEIMAAPSILTAVSQRWSAVARVGPVEADLVSILRLLEIADSAYEEAMGSLRPGQRDSLTALCAVLWSDSDEPGEGGEWGALHSAWGLEAPDSWEFDEDSVVSLLESWSGPEALPVDSVLAMALGLAELREWPAELELAVRGVAGLVRSFSFEGPVPWVIGGDGPNVYGDDCPFALIIDTGGNDTYLGRCTGAVGPAGKPVCMVLDLSGDDTYRTRGPVGQGASLMGFCALVDMEGDDDYSCGPIGQGAGMAGQGMLLDLAGDDSYRADFFSQGAGCLGQGCLCDLKGRDTYRVSCFGQGFGGPSGEGTLLDAGGHDCYLAGMLYPHAPLLIRDNRALSQGFGMGLRPLVAGGIGTLIDLGDGNDTYRAEVFGQGAAYYYGLGMLIDEDGQDSYEAAQYSQGSGIHLAVGYLWDGGGDDSYHSRYGPAQGSAHDLSVGFLVDLEGDDYYSADGGQALSLTNSAAFFLDVSGADTYLSRGASSGQGAVRWARGSGGIGVFLDMADADVYKGSAGADSSLWVSDYYGVGLDAARSAPVEPLTPDEIGHPERLGLDSLFSVAREWDVRENRERVLAHRAELAARGEQAVDYVLAEHLATLDGLALRAIEEVVERNPAHALDAMLPMLDTLSGRALRNCIYLLGEVGDTLAEPSLLCLLARSDSLGIRLGAVRALGLTGTSSSLAALMALREDSSSRIRREAAVALGAIGDSLAIPALEGLAADSCLDVRSAAEASLRALETGTAE
ncbi:HEAT repeat domain-containing protein [Candidatus Fermentibacterales bacterium]|nr:HEAT repeat domain-containing protein [Candidatus Fermentibacterales bacterium]